MAKLAVPHYSSDLFAWSGNHGVVDHSTLCGPLNDRGYWISKIYDDAEDVGFQIWSTKTKQFQLFVLSSTDKDGEGDVTGWRFESVDGHNGRLGTGKFKILVVNT